MGRKRKVEIAEETPVLFEDAVAAVEEKPAKKATPKKESKTAEEPKAAPVTETPAEVEKPVEKKAAPKLSKKSLKAGQKLTIFAARLYPSSVAKTPKYLATRECFIIDTDEHDGRIRVSADESGTKIGWADLNDLKG